jgi:anti-sigma regulatory factor (Ser/Thr protein kinase)
LKSYAAFSGDMTLVKKSPSGNFYFILADATGHGLSAAITIMPVVTLFNSLVAKGCHIQKIVTEINRKLVTDTPADRFVAAAVIEINPFRRELNIWSGGMPPVYWVNQGQIIHQFRSRHMALGIMGEDDFDASISTIDLPGEGFIFAYSDGLIEQENAAHEPFASARVIEIIGRQPQNLLGELAQSLQAHAGHSDYSDDVSVCTIDPQAVFNDIADAQELAQLNTRASRAQGAFEWSLKLSGQQLEDCEIPTLCNHFLHQLDVDQQFCQKVFSVLAEMVSNALDHGVLGLSSLLKEGPDGFLLYFQEREARLKKMTDKDFVRLSMRWLPSEVGGRLQVEVEDSGAGFTPQESTEGQAPRYSGRGRNLIQKLSETVEIIAPGNKIRATIK